MNEADHWEALRWRLSCMERQPLDWCDWIEPKRDTLRDARPLIRCISH